MLYHGIVEDNIDPLKDGRVRVRVFGLHTDDKNLIPTESLPWAQTLKSTDSASVSGVGSSATGLVRGSWVVLYFLDEDNQYPIILGSLHGIPKESVNKIATGENIAVTSTGVAQAGGLVTSDGNPVTTSDGSQVQTGTPSTDALNGARRASSFTSVSSACVNLIKSSEGFRTTAYQDSVGIWTIGYGSTFYDNGQKVKQGDTITQPEAEALLMSKINSDFLPKVQKVVSVPVTQQMVDAMVSLAYNIGSLSKGSMLVTDLNSSKYEVAASRFLEYNKVRKKDGTFEVLSGLTTRREREKNLFLSGGFPADVGGMNPAPEQPYAKAPETNKVPGTEAPTENQIVGERGFSDPTAQYPLYRNEPDTHRLSRHERIIDTIVYRKEISLTKDVPIAGSNATWNQSPVPYNTQYPHNKIICSEAGHLIELDDTPASRRMHFYHAAGTFSEIDDNGTRVNKIIGDNYEIIDRNGFVYVRGALNVTVGGAHNLKIEGAHNVDIDGATNINVYNNATLVVSGDLNTSVGGNMTTSVVGDYMLNVGGNFAVDGKRIDLNSKVTTPFTKPDPVREPEPVYMAELNVVTRGTEPSMQYETPEEGSSSAYIQEKVKSGEIAAEDTVTQPSKKTETVTETAPAKTPVGECGEIHQMTEYPVDYKLSTYFTFGDFTKGGQRKIVPQLGLAADQIACNLKMLAINTLDLVKDLYPNMIISSGFRRPGDVAQSAKTSDHYKGQAVDIQLPGYSREQYIEAVKIIAARVPYDQLILEYRGRTTWIHISYSKTGSRNQLFTMNNDKRIGGFGDLVLV